MMADQTGTSNNSYMVVARRYRPQAFEQLVGQPHVITALTNAIEQHRVGHAYLFTGARGVGKTSTARIFAKCLNCFHGPTTTPCNECDVCRSVSVGEDVDVLEIDGASNRGIDEIRQLRSNVTIRPSRCRYKIYIIDEVHMLTMQAFNALLKTLEEPPEHVKFIFCTTDPHKLPITVLSRCQRFDFAPVEANEITTRLQEIAQNEGVEADAQALQIIARRANGSMRDSQSLLEQILSSCDKEIKVNDVYRLLGTADMGRIATIVKTILSNNMPQVMGEIDAAIKSGVEVGQLAQQLVGYLRDLMAAKVGCGENLMLNATTSELLSIQEVAKEVGLETIFSMLQILDQCVVRMQHSHHSRVLLEAAALRCCELESVQSIVDLIAGLKEGSATANAPAKKKLIEPTPINSLESGPAQIQTASSTPTTNQHSVSESVNEDEPVVQVALASHVEPTTEQDSNDLEINQPTESIATQIATIQRLDSNENVVPSPKLEAQWRQTLEELGGMTADFGTDFLSIEMVGASRVRVLMKSAYQMEMCNRPERRPKYEESLGKMLGKSISITFDAPKVDTAAANNVEPRMTRFQKIRNFEKHPFVKSAMEMFGAEVIDFKEK